MSSGIYSKFKITMKGFVRLAKVKDQCKRLCRDRLEESVSREGVWSERSRICRYIQKDLVVVISEECSRS